MNNETIKKIALENGFKLKKQSNGEMDLNPYVYDFARALLTSTGGTVEMYVHGKLVSIKAN